MDSANYAYAEGRFPNDHERTSNFAVVIGDADRRVLGRIEEDEDVIREAIAQLIRETYSLREFPPSPTLSDEIACLACGYDMRGSMHNEQPTCPECGTPLRHWQAEDWRRP